MSKSKFFNETLAEAKALKQAALNNAKLSLAESFAPRINTLISETLNEQEELEETYSIDEDLDNLQEQEEEISENFLQEEDEFETPEGSEDFGGEDDFETDFEGGDEMGEEELGDEEVGEITVDELKDVLRDVMAELEGGDFEDEEIGDEFSDDIPSEFSDEEEVPVDELSENINEFSNDEVDFGKSLSVDDNVLLSNIKKAIQKSPEFLKKLSALTQSLPDEAGQALRNEAQKVSELQEINRTLKTTLKEVNLMNSKLLYSNKIFNSRNLTESQKLKVIKSFDKAENVNETKKIYSIIKESLTLNSKPKSLKENLSFASKPAGNSTRGKLNEAKTAEQSTVNRWQFLAGIK
jgi:hypothetical protein